MLTDRRKHVRELGLRRVLKCRNVVILDNSVRELNIRTTNFNADNYMDLIGCNLVTISEPPSYGTFSDNEQNLVILNEEMHISRYSCHSEGVQSCV